MYVMTRFLLQYFLHGPGFAIGMDGWTRPTCSVFLSIQKVVPQLISARDPAARGWMDHRPERVRRKPQQPRGS